MGGNFGFIHEKIEIKMLILFILRRLPTPVSLDVLTGLAMCDDGISYFDYVECVADLVKTEHIRFEDDLYSLTLKGIHNGGITENNLPFSVRQEVETNVAIVRNSMGRNAMIKALHTANTDGSTTVELSLSDGVGDIVSISLYAANEKQAVALENGFRKNAEGIYNTLIEKILNQ